MQSRSFRPRPLPLIAGLALVALGLVLPARTLANYFAQDSAAGIDALVQGAWIWKLATAALGLLCIAADIFGPRADEADALLERGKSLDAAPSARLSALALAACVLGLALRCYDLNAGMWFDEIDTLVRYGNASLARAVSSFETQNNHLAYSLLANLSIQAFGSSAWALRLPAVLLGAASLWATWRFALLVAPRSEALIATCFLALSSHHVWFSQDARGYTGMFLATLISSGAFLAMLWQRRATDMKLPLLYAASAAFGVWMHTTAVFVVVAHFAIWVVLCLRRPSAAENRWQPLWGFVCAAALALWGYALVLPQFVHTLAGPSMEGHETVWRSPLWLLRETASALAAGLPGGWFALIAGALVLGLGLRSYARQSLALLAVFLLPAVVTCTVVVLQGHNLWPRFFFFSAGFAVLLTLRGLSEFASLIVRGPATALGPKLGAGAGLLLCLASAATLPRVFGPKQDFEGAAEYVLAHAPVGAVATLEMANLPLLEYLRQPWTQVNTLQALMDFERGKAETWVILTMPTHLAAVQPQTWARLCSEYREEKVFYGSERGGEIVVKVRR